MIHKCLNRRKRLSRILKETIGFENEKDKEFKNNGKTMPFRNFFVSQFL
jgi:hypothetical protein